LRPTVGGKNYKVLLVIVVGLLGWVVVSFAVAPFVGMALRRCEVLERANSVAVLQAKAQHPASHAA
jgi:hypothetical protein